MPAGSRPTRHAGQVGWPAFIDDYDEHARLDRLEQGLRLCTLWLWPLRFPGVFGEIESVHGLARGRLNDGVSASSRGASHWQRRRALNSLMPQRRGADLAAF